MNQTGLCVQVAGDPWYDFGVLLGNYLNIFKHLLQTGSTPGTP